MSSASAPAVQRVALLGFGDFERTALVSYLRLSASRAPIYQEAASLDSADYVIADADHVGTLDTVLGADRVGDTVFIGSLAPDGALAWMMRPIDPLQVFRALDATVALRQVQRAAASAPAPMAAATAAHSAPRRVDDVSEPITALLVDDSEIALRYLERQLQALGLRTETAMDSQRALDLLAQRRYDVVFLDVELGPHSERDGLALCQYIKHQPAAAGVAGPPPVLMVSAHATTTDRVRGSFAGCDAYLAKPLDDDALRRSLRAFGLRLPASPDAGYRNSRPGALNSRPLPLEDPHLEPGPGPI